MLYVCAYLTTLGYFGLAAISERATVVPNTWHELARLGVVAWVVSLAYFVGAWVAPEVRYVVLDRDDRDATN